MRCVLGHTLPHMGNCYPISGCGKEKVKKQNKNYIANIDLDKNAKCPLTILGSF